MKREEAKSVLRWDAQIHTINEVIDKMCDSHELEIKKLVRGQEILEEACDQTISKYQKEHESELNELKEQLKKKSIWGMNMRDAGHRFNNKLTKIENLVDNCSGDDGDCGHLHIELQKIFDIK